jgi:hypothetical protein
MTAREKFLAAMRFEPGAPCPRVEFGYWAGAVRRWLREGLPESRPIPPEALDGDLVRGSRPFGFESSLVSKSGTGELVDANVMPALGLESHLAKFPLDFSPRLPRRVLEEDKRHKLFTDSYGITKLVTKENAATWHSVDFPIKSRGDLAEYIARYDEDYAGRLPAGIDELAAALAERDYPIRLGGEPFGFTYFPRALMGDVGYMTTLYDDPGLIHELCRFLLSFTMAYWDVILSRIRIDCVVILEDVAYRNGPMISRAMFDEFAAPYTARLVDFVKQYGVASIVVDCDGKIDELVPAWVKAGVTGLFPVEAVNDIVAMREAYPRLQLIGGVDKLPLIAGDRAGIDAELARISPLIAQGGFIPHIDHAVPEDMGWNSFAYYRRRLNEKINASTRQKGGAS